MNATNVHKAIISYIRELAEKEKNDLILKLISINDDILIRKMFSNVRGQLEDTRGLRLTNFGLTVMKKFFRFYEQKMSLGKKLMPLHLVYLDENATMPYYCTDEVFVMFDHQLGSKIKLADGDIDILIDIDGVKSAMENS